jgi:hypothetical protein
MDPSIIIYNELQFLQPKTLFHFVQGFKGRYGMLEAVTLISNSFNARNSTLEGRREALNSGAHYLGTWSSGEKLIFPAYAILL